MSLQRLRTDSRRSAQLLGLVLVLLGGTIVASEAQAGHAAAKPVLRLGFGDFGNGKLDPAQYAASGGASSTFFSVAYAPLLHMKPDGTIGPALATSWRFVRSPAGPHKVFSLTLRHDARFSDGTPVTAAAVVSSLKYYVSSPNGFGQDFGPKPAFRMVGRWTVEIQVEIPNPSLPILLSDHEQASFIISPRAIANPATLATRTDGAGPYVLAPSQSVIGDHYTFVPNPYYYDKQEIKFSGVQIKIIKVPSAMLQALKAGQLDVAVGDPSTAANAASSGFSISSAPTATNLLAIDIKHGLAAPLSDVRVRQAINYAIDRKAIAALGGPGDQPASSIQITDADTEQFTNAYPYNPTKARTLLAAAGYSKGFPLTLLGPGTAREELAIAKYLQAVGIDAQVKASTDYVTDVLTWKYPMWEFGTGVNDTSNIYNFILNPTSFINVIGSDPVLNKLFYTGLKSANPRPYFTRLWQRVVKQAYYLPVFTAPYLLYYSKQIGGVSMGGKLRHTALPIEWFKK